MSGGLVALVAALAVAVAGGLAWRATNGRMRPARSAPAAGAGASHSGLAQAGPDEVDMTESSPAPADTARPRVTAADLGQPLGERATLLQFSSAFCAPCRATRIILADAAARAPGIAHVEIDAESHLDLVRALGVLRTPTVFVLGADGVITARASGLPRKADVLGALAAALPDSVSYSPGLETG